MAAENLLDAMKANAAAGQLAAHIAMLVGFHHDDGEQHDDPIVALDQNVEDNPPSFAHHHPQRRPLPRRRRAPEQT